MFLIPWGENYFLASVILATLVLISIYSIIEGKGKIELTREMIVKRSLFRVYGILWQEIREIQYGEIGELIGFQTLVLEGANKRLSLPGPHDWSSAGKTEARSFFYSEVRRRGLEIKANPAAVYKFSKNVRLRQ